MKYSLFEVGRLVLLILFTFILLYRGSSPLNTHAFLDPCAASVSPASFTVSSTTTATLTVTNNSSVTAQYADFVSPSGDYVVTGGSSSGWDVEFNDTAEIAFHNGSIAPGDSQSFTINLTIGGTTRSGDIWEARLDDNADGSDLNNCSGDLSAAIVESDTTAPSISSISVTGITTSQATITWTTDESSNSVVEYGTTSSFGSSSTDSTSTTSHSVTITGLTAGTTYHYRVKSTDGSSNTATSGTNTFATSQSSSSSSPTATPTPSSSSSSPTATPTPAPDKTPPVVTISTDFEQIYESAPEISGRVTDNKGIKSIEVSLDGGNNWLTAGSITSSPTSENFQMTPDIFDDGNYETVVRATDTSGNIGYSKAHTLIIDRLVPRIGGMLVTLGAQILRVQESKTINGIVDSEHEVHLSATGGPTEITIIAINVADQNAKKVFQLSKVAGTNVWEGKLLFERSGTYTLNAIAVDGAKNTSEKALGGFAVFENGTITKTENSTEGQIAITVNVFDEQLQTFKIWDGVSYGQQNPLIINDKSYAFVLPQGKYYIEIESDRYEKLTSEIFVLNLPTVINSDFVLFPKKAIEFGPIYIPLPSMATISSSPVVLKSLKHQADSSGSNMVNKTFPIVTIFDGQTEVNTLKLRGQDHIISILNTWTPDTSQQIKLLEKITNADTVPVIIILNESASKTAVYKLKGGYSSQVYSDPDGEILEQLPIIHIPTHFWVNREGNITKIKEGLLDEKSDLIK